MRGPRPVCPARGHHGRRRPAEPVEEEDDDAVKAAAGPADYRADRASHAGAADALANDPAVAFQAVLHNFVLATFYRFASSSGCLEIAIRTPAFPARLPA